ncbi:hypothetical protein [Bacillus sp. Marseille-Q3570]|uniref:hypothetical protein n=1 Tax=Bacillus sp. Marseille-Q3570 TaxID=2963522 RepID=UPI0021B748CF|nr:hypothetical protein [Bacillus sp. Marseille-Q3570]
MNITIGQGLWLKMPFADGGKCNYERPFLVIRIDSQNNKLLLLNVSSIKGKTHKLLFDSNKRLPKYNPPLSEPSFVKLDALYTIEYYNDLQTKLLSNGRQYDYEELQRITQLFDTYRKIKKNVLEVTYDQKTLIAINS